MLKNSIGGTIGIDAEVAKVYSGSISLQFLNHNYLKLRLDKKDLLNRQRRTPIGSNLHVYIKDYDFALKKPIAVSEKVGDGLSIAQFTNIVLVQTEEEREELYQYLKERGLLDEDDEWRIGPIMDNGKLIGLKMQIGHSYAYKAFFEEIADENLVLHYGGMLPEQEMISFDDIFVSTNVTVKSYAFADIKRNLIQYKECFEECQKLRLYLINEFAAQNRIMKHSPMSVYLEQWAEITNRLIELLSYGGHVRISVEEWRYFWIRGDAYTVLYPDNPEEILAFVEEETGKGRRRFFLSITEPEAEKIFCEVREYENAGITLRVRGRVDQGTLLDHDFMLDMYSVAVPYVEKQHANAFSMFKEGRVVSEEIKTAIINTSELEYSDNGYRISSFFNQNIQTNKVQMNAVKKAFGEEHFFLIQGPPGTGKTTVIKELIRQELDREASARILVVSQANVAVDNVLRGIVKSSAASNQIQSAQIVRCGAEDKIAEDIENFSFDKKYEQYKSDLLENTPDEANIKTLREKWLDLIEDKNNNDIVGECLLGCFQIIGATCVGLENRHYGLNGMEFDLVIIDEAGKALAGELLIPINHAKKVIIIGDHKQLPPVINPALYRGGQIDYADIVEEEEQVDFLNRSFFQRLYEDCPEHLKCMLNVQFRMPPVIADLVNMFYDDMLKTGDNCYRKKPIFLNSHLIFVDMKDVEDYEEQQIEGRDGRKSGPFNEKEAEAASVVIKKIRGYYDGRIVVITPYKKQKKTLIERFHQEHLDNVWVNTIDAFQGDEEDIVLYCTTRAVKKTRYFSDSARLNVAFSRTRNTLILIGSSTYLKKYSPEHILHRVSDYLEKKAVNIQYEEWEREDFDLRYNPAYYDTNDEMKINTVKPLELPFIEDDFFETMKKTARAKPEELCKACQKVLNDGETILCSRCITKSEKYQCKGCGQTIRFSYYDKYVHKDAPPELCKECELVYCSRCKKMFYMKKNYRNKLLQSGKKLLCPQCLKELSQVYKWELCIDCGEKFSITCGERENFEEHGFVLPKRCKTCREKRKRS